MGWHNGSVSKVPTVRVWGLEFGTQHPCERPFLEACTLVMPALGSLWGPWGVLTNEPHLVGKVQDIVRNPGPKSRWTACEAQQTFWSLCACAYTCMHMRAHIHTHTHTHTHTHSLTSTGIHTYQSTLEVYHSPYQSQFHFIFTCNE